MTSNYAKNANRSPLHSLHCCRLLVASYHEVIRTLYRMVLSRYAIRPKDNDGAGACSEDAGWNNAFSTEEVSSVHQDDDDEEEERMVTACRSGLLLACCCFARARASTTLSEKLSQLGRHKPRTAGSRCGVLTCPTLSGGMFS